MKTTAFLCLALAFFGPAALSDRPVHRPEAVDQILSPNQLARIRASLPRVAYEGLRTILSSPQTLWYDHSVLSPSYQDSVGAASNATWPELVAGSETVIGGVYDRSRNRWQFPFATTAGTDHSTNLHVAKFVHLPLENGRIRPIEIEKVIRNASRPQWDWTYSEGTVFGEILFIKDGSDWLPTEIRTRKKYPNGWAMNAFRPFPRASMLAQAIRKHRPGYMMNVNLRKLMAHLETTGTLTQKTLAGAAAFADSFHQDGWIDSLPEFGDAHLVRQLLKTTEFVAAYNTPWKVNGSQVTHAASTSHSLSIVPNHYDAGLLHVTDAACMRCHKEAGRLVSEFYFDLFLYGELWGKDGIFSFHPFDEDLYSELRRSGSGPGGFRDNRRINPSLVQLFAMKNARPPGPWALSSHRDQKPQPIHPRQVTYGQHIKPILDANCAECHTGEARKTDFSRFPFPSQGQLDQDKMVRLILIKGEGPSASMPPGVRPRLTQEHIRLIKAWRDGGLQP